MAVEQVAAEQPGTVIWMRPERAGAGRPAQHSRAQITAVAIVIADTDGLDAVSMRRVAAELGTGAASLYRYLDTRDDLLDLMIDATGGEYVFAAPTGDWLADLVEIGQQARAIMRRHPWLPGLLTTRTTLGPNGLVLLEQVLRILAAHPADTATKLEAFGIQNAATAMFVQNELAGGAASQQRNARYLAHALGSGEHPGLARLLAPPGAGVTAAPTAEYYAVDPADRFGDILARVLRGLLAPPAPAQP